MTLNVKGIGKSQRTSERSEADAREELLFKGTFKSETMSNSRRKEQSSLVKQRKNAMMSRISPMEEQPSSKARKSFKTYGLSSGFDHPVLMHSDTDFKPSPRMEKSKKAMSNSPSRPMSDAITMETSSLFDRLMRSVGTQKGGASSSTRLQPQLTSSSLGFTPVLGTASDVSGMFANVMTGLEELRQDMTENID